MLRAAISKWRPNPLDSSPPLGLTADARSVRSVTEDALAKYKRGVNEKFKSVNLIPGRSLVPSRRRTNRCPRRRPFLSYYPVLSTMENLDGGGGGDTHTQHTQTRMHSAHAPVPKPSLVGGLDAARGGFPLFTRDGAAYSRRMQPSSQ